jgi:hypothetical protein
MIGLGAQLALTCPRRLQCVDRYAHESLCIVRLQYYVSTCGNYSACILLTLPFPSTLPIDRHLRGSWRLATLNGWAVAIWPLSHHALTGSVLQIQTERGEDNSGPETDTPKSTAASVLSANQTGTSGC